MVVIIETEGKTSQEIKKEIHKSKKGAEGNGTFSVSLLSVNTISDNRLIIHLRRDFISEITDKW